MTCQIAVHANADRDQLEAKVNKQATVDLFVKDQAFFSKRNIKLSDVVMKSIELDSEYITEIVCEIATLEEHDVKEMKVVKQLLKHHLIAIALVMNTNTVTSH